MSRRSRPLPPDWERIRSGVIRRDKGVCVLCRKPARQVDHIIPAWKGGDDSPGNLRLLCDYCHDDKTIRESVEAREHYKQLNKRRDRRPGFLE